MIGLGTSAGTYLRRGIRREPVEFAGIERGADGEANTLSWVLDLCAGDGGGHNVALWSWSS